MGNFIGTNAAGTSALANVYGMMVFGSNNTIGGNRGGTRNVISGNSGGSAIAIAGGNRNVVQGELIGLNAAGTAAIANGAGISVSSGGNLIGGSTTAARNVISGNTGDV